MFASGYIYIATKREHETYKGFIVKKVKRLMVPYLATSFLIITLKLITQGNAYVANPVTLSSYLFARGGIFFVVYLGFVVDVCGCPFI